MLDSREAAALATLLEQLAARQPDDALAVPALNAAALLRHRLTSTQCRHGPAARHDAGVTGETVAAERDTAATQRDTVATERDRQASLRDTAAHQRDGEARIAGQHANTTERRLLDLLWDAEQRDHAAARHAATAAPPATYDIWQQQHQVDREMAASDRFLNHQDRQAIRDVLTWLHQTRLQLQHDRYAAAVDRQAAAVDRRAARTDRQHACDDRQAAHTDRDQALIDSQLTHPGP